MTERTKYGIDRQAVVIIHGLGEQRPMETLRSFVEGITAWMKTFNPDAEKPRYWSRPDGVSDMYETRLITMERTSGNPKTDFYEFYWAHHMRNTSFSHLVPWVWKLISTKRSLVPPRLKRLSTFVQVTLIAVLILIGVVYWEWDCLSHWFSERFVITATVLAIAYFLMRVLFWIIRVPLSQLLLNTAGDAARYFNPMPSNIEERSSIRREGIDFLRKLHDRKEKPYDRIILVGHSLGSVVAYDMLRLLWHEMHESFTPVETIDHKIFKQMDESSNRPENLKSISDFQALQNECWKQYRANGNPWLISDFISCAGAIAQADFYLLNKRPFSELVKHKEFPVCPPVMEGTDRTLMFDEQTFDITADDGKLLKRTVHFLNHGAPFTVTKWTNIYFSSDFVGSAAQRVFGTGVKDIEIPRKGYWFLPSGHTNYWDAKPDNQALQEIARAMGFRQL